MMHGSEGVCSQEVRGPCILMQCMTMTYEEETACRQQPGLRCGCRVHAVSSAEVVEAVRGGGAVRGVEWLEKFCDLSACPRPWAACAVRSCC